jgi:hypothetical protein
LVSPDTRLVAADVKATKRPVNEMDVCSLKLSGSGGGGTSLVVGPLGRARTKMSISPFESGGTMAAGVAKATEEPSPEITG